MDMHSLTDDKNYNAQVNCVTSFENGDIAVAGEDGLIKIIYKHNKNGKENTNIKLPETYLEKMLDNFGYLANIEDVKIIENNGNIICVETLGNIGIYEKKNNYKLRIISNKIISDCFYTIDIINDNEVEIFGETKKRYKININ